MEEEESVRSVREEEEGYHGFRYTCFFFFQMDPAFIVQLVSSSWVVSVSGPFIVYMLRDIDILEDWTAIKKVQKSDSCWIFLTFPSAEKDLTFVCICVFQAKTALTPLKKKVESECLHTHLHRRSKAPFSWCVLSCRAVIFTAAEGDQRWGKKRHAS